jgi:hypothetical protein
MPKVISLADRKRERRSEDQKRKNRQDQPPDTITRIVDGETIEYELCEHQ